MNCQFETLLLIFLCVPTHKSSSSHTSCSVSQTYFPVLFLKGRKHLILHVFPSFLILLHWLDAFPGTPHHCVGSFQTPLTGCWDLQSWAEQRRNICKGESTAWHSSCKVMGWERMKGSLLLHQIWILRQTSLLQHVSKPL